MTNSSEQASESDVSSGPWASSAVEDEHQVTLEALQKGLTVDLIATKKEYFVTCRKNEPLSNVIEHNRSNQFDFLPVVDDTAQAVSTPGRIVGLVEIEPYRRG